MPVKRKMNRRSRKTMNRRSRKTMNRRSRKTMNRRSRKTMNRRSRKTMNRRSRKTMNRRSRKTKKSLRRVGGTGMMPPEKLADLKLDDQGRGSKGDGWMFSALNRMFTPPPQQPQQPNQTSTGMGREEAVAQALLQSGLR
jgi:hypothetical protein